MTGRLLILGASARAAAMSARRGGLECWAADRFFDLDLQRCCQAIRVANYPADFEKVLSAAPPGPWMYTGALENHPDLIDRLAALRPLYGICGPALRAVRDPLRLASVLGHAGFSTPECSLTSQGLPLDGSWLVKPIAGANGVLIQPWTAQLNSLHSAPLPTPGYFQRRIDGVPIGALFIAAAGRATLLGVTRQLLGVSWCGLTANRGQDFRYCGSVGPLKLTVPQRTRFEQLGNAVAAEFSLLGIFGVDAILGRSVDGAEEIWPIEVNPRYTASVEVLERGRGIEPIHWHVAACLDGALPTVPDSAREDSSPENRQATKFHVQTYGKAIFYAERNLTIDADFVRWIEQSNFGREWPAIADIPAVGSTIRHGQPVVSLFAAEHDELSVVAALQRLATKIKTRLEKIS